MWKKALNNASRFEVIIKWKATHLQIFRFNRFWRVIIRPTAGVYLNQREQIIIDVTAVCHNGYYQIVVSFIAGRPPLMTFGKLVNNLCQEDLMTKLGYNSNSIYRIQVYNNIQ